MHLRHLPGRFPRYHCCDLAFANQLLACQHLGTVHDVPHAEATAQVAALRPRHAVEECRQCALPRLSGRSTQHRGPRWIFQPRELEATADTQEPFAAMARTLLLLAVRDAMGTVQSCPRYEHARVEEEARLFFGAWYALYGDESFLAFWCDVAGINAAILHQRMAPYCGPQHPQETAL